MAFAIPKTKSLTALKSYLDIAVEVLAFIAKVTKTTADDKAVVALAAIKAAISTAEKGFEGKVDAARVRDALAQLRTAILANDLAAVAALKKKFAR